MGREVRIGRENAFLALSDEHEGSSTRSSRGELWAFDAALVVPGIDARTQVHLAAAPLEASLAGFFAELAAATHGWAAEREWASYEGGLTVSCTQDGLGHVNIDVRLAEANRRAWVVEAAVPLEAGQLDRVARDLAAFFGGHS